MKVRFLIILNKLITNVLKLMGKNASVFPASIILPFDKNILEKVKYPSVVIGITGSSGKGSSTKILANILKQNGKKVVWNKSGSNVKNAITTLILNNTSIISKKIKGDILLLELDEAYLSKTFKKGMLTHLVLTNITRDQPPRNYTPENILNKIINSVDERTHIIINSDDVLVNRFTLKHSGKITTFGLDKSKYSIDKQSYKSLDGAYCPVCSKKLIYSYYYYGHLGSYQCNNCNYKRCIDVLGTNIDLDKKEIKINNKKVKIPGNVIFDAYNTLSAYTAALVLGLNDEEIVIDYKESQEKSLKLDNRDVYLVESKNENNISHLLGLHTINSYKETKTLILGFDHVSKRHVHNDLSWLYDIDYTELDMESIDKIFIVGKFRFDLKNCLLNNNINYNKIILVDDESNLTNLIKENSSGAIFVTVCENMIEMTYSLTKFFNNIRKGDNNES
ncbi:MAG TPA: DUF1727 domain-containing protein [Mollicutes bacterium]|nr:DUF1727 domain-containing protein [Mollicutes bacterium]